ncbi:MAG TPA: hypothetical protein VFY45_12225 [Baekduia sp.]|nr:hypothetical protein [Baekduia sp.]
MLLLFRLPFLLLELLLRRLFGREQQHFAPTAAPERTTAPASTAGAPSRGADGAPPPTADEAIERRVAREAAEAASDLTPPTPLRPIGDAGHLDNGGDPLVESFGPADDVGATITVEEPWVGYAQQPATAIIARLRGADPATKAVVALYERGHKRRATVLRAAG